MIQFAHGVNEQEKLKEIVRVEKPEMTEKLCKKEGHRRSYRDM